MIETITNFIDKYDLANKKIVVGFSGGYDSICLLDCLIKIRKDKKITLVAAHLNHNWRGEKSRKEQEFCRDFCDRHNVDFYTETLADGTKKTETVARQLRYEFFERALKLYSADAIFTAHNFDDNAETILYRVFKGTGIVGLKGIQEKRGYCFRPLLNVSRSEIEKYCSDNGLYPNNDDSNSDTKYKRNLIRHEILPLIKEINPEIIKTLNNLAFVAQSECEIIDEYISKIISVVSGKGRLYTQKYNELSDDVKKRLIYGIIYESEIDYDYSKILDIYNFIEESIKAERPTKMSLTSDKWLYVDLLTIEIISSYEKNQNEISIKDCGKYDFEGNIFSIKKCDKRELTTDEKTAFVDLKDVGELVIRTRREGDVITPLGSKGEMKLKKYLIDKKIPQHKRDKLVLLCSGNDVLWVAGVGLSDKIKVEDSTTHMLSIEYKEEDLL